MAHADVIVRTEFEEAVSVMRDTATDPSFVSNVVAIARTMTASLKDGNKIMFAGNGGSAGDAQHIAAEFVSRLNFDRAPLAGLALTTDTSALTAIGNDYGYVHVFERQIRGLGKAGDVFVAISTSGKSPNILLALEAARAAGITTVGLTGAAKSSMDDLCDHILKVPSAKTPLIQQVHITAAHSICGLVERAIFGDPNGGT